MMERIGIPIPEGSVAGDDDSCDDFEEGEEEQFMEEDEIVEPTGEPAHDDADLEPLMLEAPPDTMSTVPLMEVTERPAKTRRMIDIDKDAKLEQQQQQVATADDQMQELANEHKPSSENPQNNHEATLSQQASTSEQQPAVSQETSAEAKQEPADTQETSTEAKQEPADNRKTSTEAKQESADNRQTSTKAKQESPGLELQGFHKKLPVPMHKRVQQEHAGVRCCMPYISLAYVTHGSCAGPLDVSPAPSQGSLPKGTSSAINYKII